MTKPSLPTMLFVVTDDENNATVSFNIWEQWADARVVTLGLGTSQHPPLPPGSIIVGQRATISYAAWLQWVDRAVKAFGTPGLRPPLPPPGLALVGADKKTTIPFFSWLRYVDGLLS